GPAYRERWRVRAVEATAPPDPADRVPAPRLIVARAQPTTVELLCDGRVVLLILHELAVELDGLGSCCPDGKVASSCHDEEAQRNLAPAHLAPRRAIRSLKGN